MSRFTDFVQEKGDTKFIDMTAMQQDMNEKKLQMGKFDFKEFMKNNEYVVFTDWKHYECYHYGTFVGNVTFEPSAEVIDILDDIRPKPEMIEYLTKEDEKLIEDNELTEQDIEFCEER